MAAINRATRAGLARCPICGLDKPLNNEDVIPSWMRRALWGHLSNDEWELPSRLKMPVCYDCNDQMGQTYENSAAPLLRLLIAGETIRGMPPKIQALIGRWAIKTVMLLHFEDAHQLGKAHEDDRLALFEMNNGGQPPIGSSVRVARFIANAPQDLPGTPLHGSLEGAAKLASLSYVPAGQLVIEVVSATFEANFDFYRRTHDDERFARVWPPSVKRIDLPPGPGVTHNDLDVIRKQTSPITPGHSFKGHYAPFRRAKSTE